MGPGERHDAHQPIEIGTAATERFFRGYCGHYCYLPLDIFCGRHLLCAKLRPANIDAAAGAKEEVAPIVAQIRERWPETRIILRAKSGFAHNELMAWCEGHQVEYVFGLARNQRLEAWLAPPLARVGERVAAEGRAQRELVEQSFRTRASWSPERRVIGKAEVTLPGANPRFVVTSLPTTAWAARALYADLYCARAARWRATSSKRCVASACRRRSSRVPVPGASGSAC